MAIDYKPVGWDTTKYVNPSNMNQMDDGIKAACDGVDALNAEIEAVNAEVETLNAEVETLNAEVEAVNSNLIGKRTITFANYYKAYSVTTEKSLMGTVMIANKECVVTVSVTQVFANVTPKLTCLQVVNANGTRNYSVATGTDCATILVHLNSGDYIELYASAGSAGVNNFAGYIQIVEI